MDVKLEDGTIVKNVPENITKAELMAKLGQNPLKSANQQTSVSEKLANAKKSQSENRLTWAEENVAPLLDKAANLAGEAGTQLTPMPLRGALPDRQNIVDVAAGASGLMRGGANLVKPELGNRMFPTSPASESSIPRTVGQLLDPVALAIGGGVGKVLPYAPVLGKGFVQGAKAVGKNMLSSGLTGVAIGALSDEGDATTGALGGVAAGALLPPVMEIGGKGIGKVIDALTGQYSKVKAGNIMRDVAGDRLSNIKSTLANAPNDVTASQAAAGAGSNKFAALGERAKQQRSQYFTDLAEVQKQAQIDEIRKIAEGSNQTEARNIRELSKQALDKITSPMRETELGAANIAGKQIPILERKIAEKTASNASAMQDAGQLYSEFGNQTNQAWKTANRKLGAAGDVKIGRNVDQAIKNYEGSADFANIGKQRLAERDFAQNQIESLAAHGLKPLDTNSMLGSIQSKLDNPKIGVSDVNKRVLTRVGKKIQEWTDKSGGVIDANALYEIRKNSVNEEVEKLMRGADPTAQAKRAAGILKEVRPMIDDAIETAGGTGWRDYLKTFESGMNIIDQKKMGAKALELYEKSPDTLISLVKGNEPKIVEKIFGTGNFDLSKQMGGKEKSIQKVVDELVRDKTIEQRAAAGVGELNDILGRDAMKFRIPNLLNRQVSIANKGLDIAENSLNQKTMDIIYDAMKTGKSANEILNTLPASQRGVIKALIEQKGMPYINAAGISAGGSQ